MNILLNWLDKKHHRIILFYAIFTISAWWILKNQIAFSYPLTNITTVTELTIMTTLKDATVITRWSAIYLDYGLNVSRFLSAIHLEDWIFLSLGGLFCLKIPNYKISTLIRTLMISELGLNLLLGYTVLSATNSYDTLEIMNSVKRFAFIELGVSLIFMGLLFVYFLRLCFHEYSD
jgi:hypothetical protein